MEALGATAEGALAGEATTVATRVAAICDKIKEHRDAGKPMSARRAALISAMIDSIAATDVVDAEEMPTTAGSKRKKARKGGARWNEELARLDETKPGVVVKSLRHGCSGDGNVGDILREACFMAACRGHPSLVGYRGVTRTPAGTSGGDDDEYSLVADSVGPSLADVLRGSGRPFPEPVVRRVMRRLLSGANAMAEHGVVHRDINPSNIQFGHRGAVKISGFGAAKHVAEKDPPRRFAGTNGYVAPELLLENADHGAPVDAWSLGCVMMELLTGTPPPFAGEEEDKNDDQLRRIFDVLGVPGRKAWQALKPCSRVVPPAAGEARQRRSRHNSQDCNVLRELVPEQVLSEAGFQVLSGLLTCDPKKRLTAAAALRCPWFTNNADDVAVVLSTAVSKIADVTKKSWSMVLQMAVSLAGRTLGLLRPKAL